MRDFLHEIIGEEQSAFVPGCLITDNVLIAHESVHAMKKRKKGKNLVCAVKLDMMKAYDRVEWSFLEQMMLKLGFDPGWIEMIMECVSSVSYKIRFNGAETLGVLQNSVEHLWCSPCGQRNSSMHPVTVD